MSLGARVSSPPSAVRTESRCRVDLAGGTLDIWPLGLLFEGAQTVNLAIELPVVVTMARHESGFVVETTSGASAPLSLAELARHADGGLLFQVANHFGLPPVRVRLDSGSPRGGGLGASSAMTVGLIAAADRLTGRGPREVEETARLARDLEARLMRLPTGTQDHYPALLGGCLAIEYHPGGTRVRRIETDLAELGRHLLIVYSGKSHFSASTNWEIIRGCLEGDAEIRGLFSGIAEVASLLPAALSAGDWPLVGELVGREWSLRRHLAAGVSVPAVDSLLSMAKSLGAWGGKACGAGGGGCVAILCPAERRSAIRDALVAADGAVIEALPTNYSLSVD